MRRSVFPRHTKKLLYILITATISQQKTLVTYTKFFLEKFSNGLERTGVLIWCHLEYVIAMHNLYNKA